MSGFLKASIATAGLLVIGGLIYSIFKCKKKQSLIDKLNVIKKEEFKEETNVDLDSVEEDMAPLEDDNNLVKRAFKAIRIDSSWDLDIISEDKCLETDRLIHLIQLDTGKLNFMLEIPEINGYSVKDFKTEISRVSEEFWKTYLNPKDIPRPVQYLEGYFIISYRDFPKSDEDDNTDKVNFAYLKMNKCLFEKYNQSNRSGLVEYIKKLRNEPLFLDSEVSAFNFESILMYDVKVIDVELFYRLDFQIESERGPGINLGLTLKFLKYLIDEIEVSGYKSGSERLTYSNIMFNAPNVFEDGKWDLFSYYRINDSTKKIEITNFEF